MRGERVGELRRLAALHLDVEREVLDEQAHRDRRAELLARHVGGRRETAVGHVAAL